jgi:membrane-bound lytic murein transglycosylase B
MNRGHFSPAVLTMVTALAAAAPAAAQGSFSECLRGLEQQARSRGVLPQVFQQATTGLTPDNSILALLDRQPEFSRQPWEYINGLVAANRIAEGRRMLQTHRAAFDRAERETGVDRHIIAAIWGIETSFGKSKGKHQRRQGHRDPRLLRPPPGLLPR